MQTFLFVIGPFLLYGGAGLAMLWAALAFITKILVPKQRVLLAQKRVLEAQYVDQLEMNAYAHKATALINSIIVHENTAGLAPKEQDELFALRALPLHDKIQSIPQKHRQAIGEMQ